MRNYFHELDTDKSGMIGAEEIEETLISLGLAKSRADVTATVKELDVDGNGELDFDEFLQMLKDTSMRNAKDNYLTHKNIYFENVKDQKKKRNKSGDFNHHLPPLIEEFQEFRFAENLRPTIKEKDMKENDPAHIEKRKEIAKKKQKIRE
jgi:hypothetical protein